MIAMILNCIVHVLSCSCRFRVRIFLYLLCGWLILYIALIRASCACIRCLISLRDTSNIQHNSSQCETLLNIQTMEELLFACEKRPYKSFSNLSNGEYIVKRFSVVETKFGTRVRVDCEGFYVFLPGLVF